jgi:hypothetical protein
MIKMQVNGPCLSCGVWFTYGDLIVFILDAEMEPMPVHLECALKRIEETK